MKAKLTEKTNKNAVLLRAYNNGSQACFDGVDSSLCPFPCESEQGREWKRGHADRFFRELKRAEKRGEVVHHV